MVSIVVARMYLVHDFSRLAPPAFFLRYAADIDCLTCLSASHYCQNYSCGLGTVRSDVRRSHPCTVWVVDCYLLIYFSCDKLLPDQCQILCLFSTSNCIQAHGLHFFCTRLFK